MPLSTIKRSARVRALFAAASTLTDGISRRSKPKVAALLKVDLVLLERLRAHIVPVRNELTRVGGDTTAVDKALADIEHASELKASSLKKMEPAPPLPQEKTKRVRTKSTAAKASAGGRLARGAS
ncbi:MAG TPA: hypothetical protein VJU83_09095 [Burkholderiales bacterium]|nr:hypothetical protein [Burkholderiales bacterium]